MPDVSFADQTLTQFLTGLAAKSPAPGGGAVAALTGAHAAALAEMVVAYSVGRPSLAAHDDRLVRTRETLARARVVMLTLADEDADAYAAFSDLRRLDASDPAIFERLQTAKAACLAAPRAVLAAGSDLLRHIEALVDKTNPHLASDLAVAAALAEACVASAAHNVRTNLVFAAEPERSALTEEVAELTTRATTARAAVEHAVREGVSP